MEKINAIGKTQVAYITDPDEKKGKKQLTMGFIAHLPLTSGAAPSPAPAGCSDIATA